MLYLYHGGGASDIEIIGESLSPEQWERLRQSVARLLRRRGYEQAAETLKRYPFRLLDAVNGFGDEFAVLFIRAPFELYATLSDEYSDPKARWNFQRIAETVSEIGPYVRFIVATLETEEQPLIPSPSLRYSTEIVERALTDAEHLIQSQGATSGVDRVHTALHGYLYAVAAASGIEIPENASLTQIFKILRKNHPALSVEGPRAGDVVHILRALASILDALNPIRNHATIVHPNEALLEEAEARLVINATRTLLYYLDAKFKAWDKA